MKNKKECKHDWVGKFSQDIIDNENIGLKLKYCFCVKCKEVKFFLRVD